MKNSNKDRIKLLKAVRDIVHQKREQDDTNRRDYRQLRSYCMAIDEWIDELSNEGDK